MIFPVIKDDAYGIGAKILVKFYADNGATAFAVSNIDEAIKLRSYGISNDILILGYTPIEAVSDLSKYDISQAVFSAEYWKSLASVAENENVTIKVHVKIDTGMGRIGFVGCNYQEAKKSIAEINELANLKSTKIEGVFTHFAVADSAKYEDIEYTREQVSSFNYIVDELLKTISIKFIHCCNSAGTALLESDAGNTVRPGIILYGISPDCSIETGLDLKPVLSLKAAISMVKNIKKGTNLSYGRTFVAKKDMKVATVTMGYADGYPRCLSNKGRVLINGKYANIIGRICMDQFIVDVTDIDDVKLGDTAVLIGKSEDEEISIDEVAKLCDTISYEIVTGISQKVPRLYIEDGNIIHIEHLGGFIC